MHYRKYIGQGLIDTFVLLLFFFLHVIACESHAILRYTYMFRHRRLLHAVKIDAAINIYLFSLACLVSSALQKLMLRPLLIKSIHEIISSAN